MSKATLLALALAAAGTSAHAADLSYNYVQADLIGVDINGLGGLGINPDMRGFDVKGSYAFSESFYAIAGYRDADDDFRIGPMSVNISYSQFNIGLGYRAEATENTDWLLEVEYLDEDFVLRGNGSSERAGDSGYRVATGLRGKASEKVELYGKITYSDANSMGNGAGAHVGAVIGLNETWGITAEYQLDRRDQIDFSQIGLGVRASF